MNKSLAKGDGRKGIGSDERKEKNRKEKPSGLISGATREPKCLARPVLPSVSPSFQHRVSLAQFPPCLLFYLVQDCVLPKASFFSSLLSPSSAYLPNGPQVTQGPLPLSSLFTLSQGPLLFFRLAEITPLNFSFSSAQRLKPTVASPLHLAYICRSCDQRSRPFVLLSQSLSCLPSKVEDQNPCLLLLLLPCSFICHNRVNFLVLFHHHN